MKYIHPSDNTSEKGMRIYGVYEFDNYPDWNVLVTDFGEYSSGIKTMSGLAFFKKDGTLDCMVELQLPISGKEIGYIYRPNSGFKLQLEPIATESKSMCDFCEPPEFQMCNNCLGC